MVTERATSLDLLERSLQQVRSVLAAIRPDQGELPTPCAEWNVRTLAGHVAVQDLRNFAIRARGEMADWHAPYEDLGDDWVAQFDAGAGRLQDAWHAADPNRQIELPGGRVVPLISLADQQIAELCVHAWDLARATGQHVDLDMEAAEHALQWSRHMLRPDARGAGKAFGVEVPVSEDAPVYDRLAGWFGRDPHWSPPSPLGKAANRRPGRRSRQLR